MKIELYLKTEKGIVKGSDTQILPPMTRWGTDRMPGSFQAKKTFIDYSEKGNRIKELLENIASKHNFELIIYDISKSRDAIHAKTKDIHNTPAVIIDNHKFEDDSLKDLKEKRFMAIRGAENFEVIGNWIKKEYSYDKRRNSKHEFYVYRALNIKITNNAFLCFSFSDDKKTAMRDCETVYRKKQDNCKVK